jgi:hypothetical protein
MRTLLMAMLFAAFCTTHAEAGTKKTAVPKVDSRKEAAPTCSGCGPARSATQPATEERFESVPMRPSRSSLTFRDWWD